MADLHPLVAGFSDAEAYERGRVGYPPAVVDAIADALALRPGATVLDLGAGTGKLSRLLVAAGFDTVAVEPLPQMRAILGQAIGPERVREGMAEAIPVGDASVDGITCAESFHWFDERRAMPEIRRVLRPGGGVAVLGGESRLPAPWEVELWKVLNQSRPAHPGFGERTVEAVFTDDPAFGPVSDQVITALVTTDREGILAGAASASWIGAMPVEERRAVLARAEEILQRKGVGEVTVEVAYRLRSASLRT